MADPLYLPSCPKPDNRPRLLAGPLGSATRDDLKKLFSEMPKSLRTETFYCILFLPWAFRAEFGQDSMSERFMLRYLFGINKNYEESCLSDGSIIVSVDVNSIRRERVFRELETKALQAVRIRLHNIKRMYFHDPDEDNYGNTNAMRRYYEQARNAVKPPAHEIYQFTLPQEVLQQQITTSDLKPLREKLGYLGKVAHSTEGIVIDSVINYISGTDSKIIRDYVASIGGNALDIFTSGQVERLNENEFKINLTDVLYFFSDHYEFNEPSDQPLGRWDPDRGLVPLGRPFLRNRDFQDFRRDFVTPFNNLAGQRQILKCQPFRVRCNPVTLKVSGTDYSVVCKF